MSAAEQARFIKENLGPAFSAAGITTKIVIYDHNADRLTILWQYWVIRRRQFMLTDQPFTFMADQ